MLLVLDLLKEMIAEEEDLMSKMKLRTQEYQAELAQLCKDLSAPLKEVIDDVHLIFSLVLLFCCIFYLDWCILYLKTSKCILRNNFKN